MRWHKNKDGTSSNTLDFIMGIGAILCLCVALFLIQGCCTTEDREMMEHNGVDGIYDCVLTAGGGAFCR